MAIHSFVLLAATATLAAEAPSPQEVLRCNPSRTGAVVDSGEVRGYFETVAARSNVVRLDTLGLSTEGRPLLMAVISSPENLARLDEIRQNRERVFALVTCGIHPVEVGPTLASLSVLFGLATSTGHKSSDVLKNVVVLLVPCVNPDGTDRVAEWLRARKGDRTGSFPFLQHRYAGHDLNRDWMLGSQVEVRALMERAHNRYRPWITIDVHQMSTHGPRIFLPPYAEPADPAIPSDLLSSTEDLGERVLDSLARRGLTGGAHRWTYDAWTPARAYPFYHGGRRFLVEVASAHFSDPLFLKEESLSVFGKGNQASENYPVPWKGGRWGIEEITAYTLAAVETALAEVAEEPPRLRQAEHLRSNPLRPGFVLEGRGDDPFLLAQVLSGLKLGGVQVFPARDPGGFLVQDPEWGRGWCEALLSCSNYPLFHQASQESSKPYDTTCHDLVHLAGIQGKRRADLMGKAREAGSILLPGKSAMGSSSEAIGGSRWLASQRSLSIFSEVADIIDSGAEVSRLEGPVEAGGLRFSPGDFVLAKISRRWVERIVLEGANAALWNETASPDGKPSSLVPVNYPSLRLLHAEKGSEDEGWLRWMLEEHGFRFRRLSGSEISQGIAPVFDSTGLGTRPVLLISEGTLGQERPVAAAELRALVKNGCRVIAMGRAAREIVQLCELPLEEAGQIRPSLPGTLLGTKFARESAEPLLWGYSEPPGVFYSGGPLWIPRTGSSLSGAVEPILILDPKSANCCGLLPQDKKSLVEGAIAMARIKEGDQGGQWVLFGFSPCFRGWTLATFRLLFNAILAP